MLRGKGNCPPQQQQVIGGPKPVEPVTPTAPAAAAPAAPAAPEEAAAPTMMKKGLKNGAPMKTDPRKTPEYKRALQSERDLYAADNRKKNKGTIKGKMIEKIERGVDKVKRKFGASDPTPKGMATPKRVAPHEMKHGGMKKARLGGLRAQASPAGRETSKPKPTVEKKYTSKEHEANKAGNAAIDQQMLDYKKAYSDKHGSSSGGTDDEWNAYQAGLNKIREGYKNR